MALIKCPECKTEVSDKADVCPKCAYPIQGTVIPRNRKVFFALLIMLFGLFVVFLGGMIVAFLGIASQSIGFGFVVMFLGGILIVIGGIKLFKTKLSK